MASSAQKLVHIEPKGLYYHSDGTGRDTYVLKFNGGLFSQSMQEQLKPRPQNSYTKFHFQTKLPSRKNPPAFENKVSHYHSDGTGRDTYVSINEGGRACNYLFVQKQKNKLDLRNYEKMPTIHDQNSGLHLLSAHGYRTPKQIREQQMRSTLQSLQSQRLSQNKPKLHPQQRCFTPNTQSNYKGLSFNSKKNSTANLYESQTQKSNNIFKIKKKDLNPVQQIFVNSKLRDQQKAQKNIQVNTEV